MSISDDIPSETKKCMNLCSTLQTLFEMRSEPGNSRMLNVSVITPLQYSVIRLATYSKAKDVLMSKHCAEKS